MTGGTGFIGSNLAMRLLERDRSRPYIAYVAPDTRLDIIYISEIYISEAIDAILGLHDAPSNSLKLERRVYNIAGIRTDDGQAPTALDIKNVVVALKPDAVIDFEVDPVLQKTVTSFGVLKDAAAQADWGWKGPAQRLTSDPADATFSKEVREFPKRIKSLELFGA